MVFLIQHVKILKAWDLSATHVQGAIHLCVSDMFVMCTQHLLLVE